MSGFLLLVTRRALLMSPNGQNASGMVSSKLVGWLYLLLFPCIFDLSKFLNAFLRSYAALPIRCKALQNILATLQVNL